MAPSAFWPTFWASDFFPKQGPCMFRCPYNQDHSILGSDLKLPLFWETPKWGSATRGCVYFCRIHRAWFWKPQHRRYANQFLTAAVLSSVRVAAAQERTRQAHGILFTSASLVDIDKASFRKLYTVPLLSTETLTRMAQSHGGMPCRRVNEVGVPLSWGCFPRRQGWTLAAALLYAVAQKAT